MKGDIPLFRDKENAICDQKKRSRSGPFLFAVAVATMLSGAIAAAEPSVDNADLDSSGCTAAEDPLFSFGVIADVQYADKPDRQRMHYRSSLSRLRQCLAELNRRRLDFTIQLGDLIDGYTRPDKTPQKNDVLKSQHDLDRILPEFARLETRLYHVVGNHCLRAGRKTLHERLGLERAYYDFVPAGIEGWRMVVRDSMGVGYGDLGKEQTKWLEKTLAKARQRNEQVILFNHFPLLAETATRYRVVFMKNQGAIRRILDRSGCVVAYFAGHDHAGAYANDRGIHHVTFQAMAEAPGRNAFAIVDVFDDRIVVHGFGSVPRRWPRRPGATPSRSWTCLTIESSFTVSARYPAERSP